MKIRFLLFLSMFGWLRGDLVVENKVPGNCSIDVQYYFLYGSQFSTRDKTFNVLENGYLNIPLYASNDPSSFLKNLKIRSISRIQCESSKTYLNPKLAELGIKEYNPITYRTDRINFRDNVPKKLILKEDLSVHDDLRKHDYWRNNMQVETQQ